MSQHVNHNIIYCIGDSHVNLFSGRSLMQPIYPVSHVDRVPLFKTFRLGEVLAYNLIENSTTSKGREKLHAVLKTITKGSKIMLIAGEIDCRAHLLKQAAVQKKDIKDVVKICVDRYFSVIVELKKLGYEMIIWNLPPSTKWVIKQGIFSTYGTCRERNNVIQLFNNRLNYLAKKYRLSTISIFNNLTDKEGLTKMKYYLDDIHLSILVLPWIIKEFKKNIFKTNKDIFNNKVYIYLLPEFIFFYLLFKIKFISKTLLYIFK